MPVVGYCRNLHINLCPCFVCCKKFSLDNGVEDLLTHICFTHRIIIENIDNIADFQKYMEYYTKRYREAPLKSFTREIIIEVPENDAEPREHRYYSLGDLPEDEALRKNLHSKRLKAAQKQQKKDLNHEYYIRHCFYCHQTLEVTNSQLVNHLRSHGFQLGHPEKLVYIERFIEAIEDTFRNLHCLYCDLEFESCRALVTHMEERGHQKIHPNNRFYDQFYMINYVEFGKTWLDFVKEKNQIDVELECPKVDDDTDWSSWGTEPECITCLFCKHVCRSWDGTLLHIQVSHNFDFKARVSHLKFYQQVKVVNYIRHRISNGRCINCEFASENVDSIIDHMERSGHLTIPEQKYWNCKEYLFCTLENDMFLYHLEDLEDENDNKEYLMEQKWRLDVPSHVDANECGGENGSSSSLSPDTSGELQREVVSSVDELDECGDESGDIDDAKNCNSESSAQPAVVAAEHTVTNVTETQKIELRCGDESQSAAHLGAGDSVQKICVTEEAPRVQQMGEFGDV